MNERLQHGVCLFDDPRNPASGVVSLGGEPRRVAGLQDLDTAAIWWTNIPYDVFRTQRLFNFANLRSDQLLRSRMATLLAELGLSHAPLPTAAGVLERLMNRVLRLMRQLYGIDCGGLRRLDWEFRKHIMPSGRRLDGPLAGVQASAKDAHQYFNTAAGRPPSGYSARSYVMPRLPYARALLSLPCPDPRSHWELVTFKTDARLTPGNLPAPLSENRAALVRVNIKDMAQELFNIAPFTRRDGRRNVVERLWCTLPEALAYAEHAEVWVGRAWIGDLAPIAPRLALPPDNLGFSFSAGIIAENQIFAISGIPSGASNGLEPIASYLLSYDRIYLMRLARRFYDEGFHPMSHGCMHVALSLNQADIDAADALAVEMGLEPPMKALTGAQAHRSDLENIYG